jgi:hypothetical protein
MLKTTTSCVLVSPKSSTYPRGYALYLEAVAAYEVSRCKLKMRRT